MGVSMLTNLLDSVVKSIISMMNQDEIYDIYDVDEVFFVGTSVARNTIVW